MCNFCENYEKMCLVCGTVSKDDYKNIQPYVCERRNIKDLVGTNTSDLFVWVLTFRGTPVKVGCGYLRKLYNETLPNPRYCRFDTVIIYYVSDKWVRNELATYLCGIHEDTVCNRQGWLNYRYCKITDLIMPAGVSNPFDAFGEQDFNIGDTPYWDLYKLQRIGIRRRKMSL